MLFLHALLMAFFSTIASASNDNGQSLLDYALSNDDLVSTQPPCAQLPDSSSSGYNIDMKRDIETTSIPMNLETASVPLTLETMTTISIPSGLETTSVPLPTASLEAQLQRNIQALQAAQTAMKMCPGDCAGNPWQMKCAACRP